MNNFQWMPFAVLGLLVLAAFTADQASAVVTPAPGPGLEAQQEEDPPCNPDEDPDCDILILQGD